MTGERQLSQEPMLELYTYEVGTLLEQLETTMIGAEADWHIKKTEWKHLIKAAHDIKIASAMMLFPDIASAADALEILLTLLKNDKTEILDYENICDLILEALEFIKSEVKKAANGIEPNGIVSERISRVRDLAVVSDDSGAGSKPPYSEGQKYYITQASVTSSPEICCYHARILFEKNCQMENIRAFTVVHNLRENCQKIYHSPKDLISDPAASAWIVRNGLDLYFSTELSEPEIRAAIEEGILIREYTLERVENLAIYAKDLMVEIPDNKARGKPLHLSSQTEEPVVPQVQRVASEKMRSPDLQMDLEKLETMVGEILRLETVLEQFNGTAPGSSDFGHTLCALKDLTGGLHDLVKEIRRNKDNFLETGGVVR